MRPGKLGPWAYPAVDRKGSTLNLGLAPLAKIDPRALTRFFPDQGETQRRPPVCRRLEKPLCDRAASVVVEVHLLNSGDRVLQPGIGDDAMFVVRVGRRRRRQLLNGDVGRRGVVSPVCSGNIVLVQNAPPP